MLFSTSKRAIAYVRVLLQLRESVVFVACLRCYCNCLCSGIILIACVNVLLAVLYMCNCCVGCSLGDAGVKAIAPAFATLQTLFQISLIGL